MRAFFAFLILCATVLLCAAPPAPAAAQAGSGRASADTSQQKISRDTVRGPYGAGFTVLLTDSGFGLGGYGSRALGPTTTLVFELHFAAAKDAREATFFDRLGREGIPDKRTHLLLVPVRAGVQQRLFARQIEDNFQPYVHLAFGPTLGWAYPHFNDENGNDELDEGEETFGTLAALRRGERRVGFGAALALGARFGSNPKAVRSVRIGYAFSYLMEPVQLLEPSVREAQQFFGTPTITLTIGRMW